MPYGFVVSDVFRTTPDVLYDAWMSSEGHSAMTGAPATVDPRIGGAFEAWDGYITGRTLVLEPGRRIVQSWRTSEFSDVDGDSQIDVAFELLDDATRIVIRHGNVPDGHHSYEEGGWQQHYFEPMRAYFEGN